MKYPTLHIFFLIGLIRQFTQNSGNAYEFWIGGEESSEIIFKQNCEIRVFN